MVHHYEEEKVKVDGKVTVNVLPHPSALDGEVKMEPIEEEPPPVERQMPELPEFFQMPPPSFDPSIRDLSYALFASFFLGVAVAGSVAFFSRRTYTDA